MTPIPQVGDYAVFRQKFYDAHCGNWRDKYPLIKFDVPHLIIRINFRTVAGLDSDEIVGIECYPDLDIHHQWFETIPAEKFKYLNTPQITSIFQTLDI